MDKFLETIMPEIKTLVKNKRTSEAIYALEDTISWLLAQLGMIWCSDYTDLQKAEEYLRLADKIKGGSWEFHINLAHILNMAEKLEEAKKESFKAINYAEGRHYEPYYNLGVILANMGDHEGAIDAYSTCMKLKGDEPNEASFNISSSFFLTEQWEEGWKHYENRFLAFDKIRSIKNRFKTIYKPGDPIKGKTIYVFSEQGVGDLIQFVRYLPKLKGAKVIVEAQEDCAKLIEDNFDVVVIPRKDGIWPEVPEIDYAVSVCSLPGIFQAYIKPIPNKPYIKAPGGDPFPFKTEKIKVGIVWSGSANHPNDYRRSIFLSEFLPLTKLENVQLFSLQKETGDFRTWKGKRVNLTCYADNILALSGWLKNYSDTAYCIDQMDLIISVDTSVAHLAGAMGKPVWMLLDKNNDWRWGLKSNKTPWYPTMQLFRQKTDWASVFEEITKKLAACQILPLDQRKLAFCGKTNSKKQRCRNNSL